MAQRTTSSGDGGSGDSAKTIRVLLLDDLEDNLLLRSTILRQRGYDVVTASSIEEAEEKLHDIDIAVLDYHLGAGKFGTEVAETLRQKRPQVPIIILSATLERKFGGIADMHLLKGYSSVDDLLAALPTARWTTCWPRCAPSKPSAAANPWWWTRATFITHASAWPWARTWCWKSWTATATGST